MNRSASRLARLLCTVTLLLGVPFVARAGSSDDSPARCTRPANTSVASATAAAAPRVTAPAQSAPRTPAINAQRFGATTRITRPGQSLTVSPVAPSLTAKRTTPPADRADKADKATEKPSEVIAPAVPGLGRLLRMNVGTDDEISWLRGPRDKQGSTLT